MKIASLSGKYLQEEGIIADVIVCSPAERARMTAELVATQLAYELNEIQCVDNLYEASVREFVDYLTKLNDRHKQVLIIGHNPTITYAADYLCDSEIGALSPGSVVHINFPLKSWGGLAKGCGEFINFYDRLAED
jgi:phosphohistidine phosphatase